MGLFSDDHFRPAFAAAGVTVAHDEKGLMDRGLYIGTWEAPNPETLNLRRDRAELIQPFQGLRAAISLWVTCLLVRNRAALGRTPRLAQAYRTLAKLPEGRIAAIIRDAAGFLDGLDRSERQ